MPKKFKIYFLISFQSICFLSLFLSLNNFARASEPVEQVVLTMGSWRTDDIRQMNFILDKFHQYHPGIRIIFDPTPAPEYDAVLKAQLKGNTAPDLFYLRSFGISNSLYERGFLESLDNLPGLKKNFDPAMTAPWTSEEGIIYGVPFIAVSHGIYYNIDIFKKLNLELPQTWESFLETCQTIKESGIIPLANASGDSWTMNEIIFFNLAPNFLGGKQGRMAYLSGKRCFNDKHMVAALTAVGDLLPYMSRNQALLKYADSLQLFAQGKAAMWMGGSWDIPYFMDEKLSFQWSVFAPPPPEGSLPYITFHLDTGMGLNVKTKHKKAAMIFLQWMTTLEFGQLLGNQLPGFFPMHRDAVILDNDQANTFLSLNKGRGKDIRLPWEKLRRGSPDGYMLMMDAAMSVLNRTKTPEEAAGYIQDGLSQWFVPARNCTP